MIPSSRSRMISSTVCSERLICRISSSRRGFIFLWLRILSRNRSKLSPPIIPIFDNLVAWEKPVYVNPFSFSLFDRFLPLRLSCNGIHSKARGSRDVWKQKHSVLFRDWCRQTSCLSKSHLTVTGSNTETSRDCLVAVVMATVVAMLGVGAVVVLDGFHSRCCRRRLCHSFHLSAVAIGNES
jgi:hypothetical protein